MIYCYVYNLVSSDTTRKLDIFQFLCKNRIAQSVNFSSFGSPYASCAKAKVKFFLTFAPQQQLSPHKQIFSLFCAPMHFHKKLVFLIIYHVLFHTEIYIDFRLTQMKKNYDLILMSSHKNQYFPTTFVQLASTTCES